MADWLDGLPAALLADRIRRAVEALNGAPDTPAEKTTHADRRLLRSANDTAWTILTEGLDPPTHRGDDVEPGR